MRRVYVVCLFLLLTTTFLLSQSSPVPLINPSASVASPIRASQADPKAQARILDSYGEVPLGFEASRGQTDSRVKFLSRTSGYTFMVAPSATVTGRPVPIASGDFDNNDITVLANAGAPPPVTPTTTSVTSATNPSKFGQSVTFTATVTPTPDGGTVNFTSGSTALCSGVPVSTITGKATCAYSTLPAGSDPVTAVYSGDLSFSGSTGNLSPNQTVNKADTTTTPVTSSHNPSVFGQSVTLAATVSPVAPGAGTPTGTVTFLDGGSAIGTGTLSGGVATFSTSALAVGNHTITTTYPGDGNFNGSTGSLTGNPQVVTKANTTTAVTSSQNPSVFGQSVTFSATVSAVPPGAGTPTGQVQLVIDGANVGAPVTLAAGSASFPSISTLSTGSHTVAVNYLGDPNFLTSTGNLPTQTVIKATTTTTVTSSLNPSIFNQSVTFTATVSAVAPGAGTPTGTVTFTYGSTTLCSNVALTGGVATCAYATLPVGSDVVTASYSGDTNFSSSSGTITQTVNKASATTTTVTSTPNPSVFNQSVTFTATVTPTPDGGTVTFIYGTTTLCSNVALTGGVAVCSYATLPLGSDVVTAAYSGDANFGSSSGTVTQTVNKASTTTTVTSTPNPSAPNQSVTFTATVTPTPDGGTVTFTYGSTTLCSNVALTRGVAKCAYAALPVGSDIVTAAYSGDTNFSSSSGTVTQTVRTPTLSVLYSFKGVPDGRYPYAGLVLDAKGNLYGTTYEGADQVCYPYGCGTVFKVDANSKETVLYSFTGTPDGSNPYTGYLVRDAQGNLYGTTQVGGAYGNGTVFKVDTTGKEMVLYSFTGGGDGAEPYGGLVRDALLGNLYGTTIKGGAYGVGTVFKVDTTGKETVLHSFTGTAGDGAYPWAGLVRDAKGNLYGTTAAGGSAYGTVFEVDVNGKEKVLYSFTGTPDGASPLAGLVRDGAGNLYGTTNEGGASCCGGTVFKVDKSGKETVLHSFTSEPDGLRPYAGVVRDTQGNLYGTTALGGNPSNYGTVFMVDAGGNETVLYRFTSSGGDGAYPYAGLVRDVKGNLYGTTFAGGNLGYGTVFKLTP
jgi:uncharacterized repeat protein (TIGR03803 family)